MNPLRATLKKINTLENLNLIYMQIQEQKLSMMSLELNENICLNSEVILSIKPSHISISKDLSLSNTSSNQLFAKIIAIRNGKILSSVQLQIANFEIEAIISADSSKSMNLHEDDDVSIFINPSDIAIARLY